MIRKTLTQTLQGTTFGLGMHIWTIPDEVQQTGRRVNLPHMVKIELRMLTPPTGDDCRDFVIPHYLHLCEDSFATSVPTGVCAPQVLPGMRCNARLYCRIRYCRGGIIRRY